MSDSTKAVFLSYASQDAEAARRIAEALRSAGVEVWFDQSELRGGDSWDAAIRKQIKECALFVPIISAHTQERSEGYFRLEWRLADQRTHLMGRAKAFLMPVCIDDTRDAEADVPDSFTAVQWTRLPNGETPPVFCERVKRLLFGEVAPVSDRRSDDATVLAGGQRPALPKKSSRSWLVPAVVGVVVVAAAIFLWRPWQSGPAAAGSAALSTPLSPARELVAKARHLFEEEDDSNRGNFLLAEDLLLQAEKLDPFDGEVWAAHAQLSGSFLNLGYDRGDQRRADLRRQAERAIKLAPDSLESQLANAHYLLSQPGTLPEAERMLTAVIKRAPDDWRPLRIMANVVLRQGRPEEGYAWADRAAEFPEGAAVVLLEKATWLFIDARFDEAQKAVDESLAIRPLGRALLLKIRAQVLWQGDLDGAKATVEKVPPSLLLEDRGAFNAFRVWLWRREPEKALSVLHGVSRDFLEDGQFVGPKSVLVAAAQRLAGRPDLAKFEWELALRVIDERLRPSPNQSRLLYLRTLCLVELGRVPEAEEALRAFQQSDNEGYQMWPGGGLPGLLLKLGRPSEALDHLAKEQQSGIRLFNSRAVLGLNPDFDPLRGDPRFQEILARAPGPAQTAAGMPVSESKSIAVLPFTNMSEEKENAFFADGVQEDILTNLSNIHELRVVSRTSVMGYRGTTKTLPQIAQELGVAYILEGSVRRAGDKVRVTSQLIRAATDEHIWAKSYDRDLTDIFAIQSEVAQAIATALQAVISPQEKSLIEQKPTDNIAAYDAYTKARQILSAGAQQNFNDLVPLLKTAVLLDPKFAQAWAELGSVYARRYFDYWERTQEVLDNAKDAINKAVALAPDDPVVIQKLGDYYYYGLRDYPRAARQYRLLADKYPNYAPAQASLAFIDRRMGRWGEAIEGLRRAVHLEPRNLRFSSALVETYTDLRHYEEAEALHREVIAQGGGNAYQEVLLAAIAFEARGSTEAFDALADKFAADPKQAQLALSFRYTVSRVTGNLEAYIEAAGQIREMRGPGRFPWEQECNYALALKIRGDTKQAKALVEKRIGEERAKVEKLPLPRAWMALSIAYAVLDNKPEALRCAQAAIDLVPESADATEGVEYTRNRAMVLAWLGEEEEALAEVARLLKIPGGLKVEQLRRDPFWKPLRGDPRFETLVNNPKNNAPLL